MVEGQGKGERAERAMSRLRTDSTTKDALLSREGDPCVWRHRERYSVELTDPAAAARDTH